jgi:hypothetical protein
VLEIFRPLDSAAARTAEKPASDSACHGLRCRGQPEGTEACVQVSDKPGDHVLCACRAGVPTSSGRCPPGTSCQDANDDKASCRAT